MAVQRRKTKTRSWPVGGDKIVRGLLLEVRAGNLRATLVLADRLDETGHPAAKRVKQIVTRRWRRIDHWREFDFSRSRVWTRWESIGWELWFMRREVLLAFGWKAKSMVVVKLYEMNEE